MRYVYSILKKKYVVLDHALERTQLVKITVKGFLDDILSTNSMHIIVRC